MFWRLLWACVAEAQAITLLSWRHVMRWMYGACECGL